MDTKTIHALAAHLSRVCLRPKVFVAYAQPRSIAAELFELEQQLDIPPALRYHNRDHA
jgi:hypothetical protein